MIYQAEPAHVDREVQGWGTNIATLISMNWQTKNFLFAAS